MTFFSTSTQQVWRISPCTHSDTWTDPRYLHGQRWQKVIIPTAIITRPEYIQNTKSNNTFMQNYIYGKYRKYLLWSIYIWNISNSQFYIWNVSDSWFDHPTRAVSPPDRYPRGSRGAFLMADWPARYAVVHTKLHPSFIHRVYFLDQCQPSLKVQGNAPAARGHATIAAMRVEIFPDINVHLAVIGLHCQVSHIGGQVLEQDP